MLLFSSLQQRSLDGNEREQKHRERERDGENSDPTGAGGSEIREDVVLRTD